MNETLCYKCGGAICNDAKYIQHIRNWRDNNREKYREMCRKAQAKYRQNNKEKIKQYKKEYYLRKKQEKDNNYQASKQACFKFVVIMNDDIK